MCTNITHQRLPRHASLLLLFLAQRKCCCSKNTLVLHGRAVYVSALSPAVGMQPPLPPEAVRELVRSCLHRDPVAADLRCSLFLAAAQSYKRDSLLRPFPPRYLRGDVKDFEELVRKRWLKAPNNRLFCHTTTRWQQFTDARQRVKQPRFKALFLCPGLQMH